MKRYKMSKKKSRRSFTKNATRVNKKNFRLRSMRGGIRF